MSSTITRSGAIEFFEALHYSKSSSKIAEGTQVATIGWGTLTLNTPEGVVTCHASVGGFVENPKGGGIGIGETQQFATWACSQTTGECKTVPGLVETRVSATAAVGSAPTPLGAVGASWKSKLIGPAKAETTVGSAPTEAKEATGLRVACYVSGALSKATVFYGTWSPKTKTGTSAAKPTVVEFGGGTGELESFGASARATVSGKTKLLGYEEQELITVA